ncbi:MAG: EI24 domain-containing protein [Pseudomonadota bacterium]
MELLQGLIYNVKGLILALRTPRLLLLGCIRFVVVVLLTLMFSGLVLMWHTEILNLIWSMPESGWLVILWKAVSWLLSLVLAGIAALIAYLTAQVFFCVFIMDYMSRITERMILGTETLPRVSMVQFFFYLIRQEIPRAVIPVVLMMVFMILGILTPLGPAVAVIVSMTAAAFLAWDNTDLVAARRMQPFGQRFAYFRTNLGFHLGFGLWFLIPWVNIAFLSFAPVGATLYYLDQEARQKKNPTGSTAR